MAVSKDKEKIKELLERGVENIYPSRGFLESALKKGKQLTLYTGYDPTGPSLHIGHGITLLKLRQFQELGHKIIMLIGDFTGMIGDPTDKSAARKRLTPVELKKNCTSYKKQASKIISFSGQNAAQLKYNNKWLGKMSFADVVELASNFTVQRLLERDMFQKRVKDGKPVYLHEFLYPIMQGYDSVAMDVDGEVGGNDQTFNMLAGRTLMKSLKGKEKFVVTGKLLTDTSGDKMGKTTGNMIAFSDSADEMFGKVMSWTDAMIVPGFELCTTVPMVDIKDIESELKSGMNPRDAKLRLAIAITSLFSSKKDADAAHKNFLSTFQKGNVPDDMPEFKFKKKSIGILDLLVESSLASSKSEARRVVQQGGVQVSGKKVSDINQTISISKEGVVVQKGKRHFVRVKKS